MPVDDSVQIALNRIDAETKNLVARTRMEIEDQIRALRGSVQGQGAKLDRVAEQVLDVSEAMYGTKEPVTRIGVYTMVEELYADRREFKIIIKWAVPVIAVLQGLGFLGVNFGVVITFFERLAGVAP